MRFPVSCFPSSLDELRYCFCRQVVIADWAKRSKVPLGHYQRAFADAHDLCSLNEVRRVHAYVAKVRVSVQQSALQSDDYGSVVGCQGYYLPNAITATLMERTGLKFVVYRDVFWLEVTTVTKPSLLRAVIGTFMNALNALAVVMVVVCRECVFLACDVAGQAR
jgi:hypothetical protein